MSILGNNLLAQYYAQNQGLPFGYEAVEYLESTGKQYIDSGISLSSNSRVECDWMCPIHSTGSYYAFGVTDNVNNFGVNQAAISGFLYYVWGALKGSLYGIDVVNNYAGVRHTINMSKNGIWVNNAQKVQAFSQTFAGRENAFIFWSNGTAQPKTSEKIYSLKIWNNTSPERNFIPCVRKSDGKPGLYDLCRSICPLTGTPFYINAGTGEFVTP